MKLYVPGVIILLSMFLLSLMARAFPVPEEYEAMRMRTRRGFRAGAADRISHGFGKRSSASDFFSQDLDSSPDDGYIVTDEVLADYIHRNSRLALQFVRTYVDINDDGVISDDELIA